MYRRICLLLFSAMLSPFASAAFNFPLKIVTCETFLKSAQSVADYTQPRASLRYFKDRLEAHIERRGTRGLDSIYYKGSLGSVDPLLGPEVFARLSALDYHLNNTNLDMQLIAIEFRGQNFARAVDLFLKRGSELRDIYHRARNEAFPLGDRVGAKVFNTMVILGSLAHVLNTLIAVNDAVASPSISQVGWAAFYTAMTFFPVSLAKLSFQHNVGRRDIYHDLILKFARDLWKDPSTDRFMVAGSTAIFPAQYHRMLMDYNASAELERQGRIAGIHELGGGLMLKYLSELTSGRIVSIFSDLANHRKAFFDHVLYVDAQTGKPVWLIVYRAFRPRFGSRARAVDEMQENYDWLPGARPAGGN